MNRFILSLAAWAARVLPVPVKQAIYKIKPLARLIRRGLNQAAPQGIVPVTVAGGDLAEGPGVAVRVPRRIQAGPPALRRAAAPQHDPARSRVGPAPLASPLDHG